MGTDSHKKWPQGFITSCILYTLQFYHNTEIMMQQSPPQSALLCQLAWRRDTQHQKLAGFHCAAAAPLHPHSAACDCWSSPWPHLDSTAWRWLDQCLKQQKPKWKEHISFCSYFLISGPMNCLCRLDQCLKQQKTEWTCKFPSLLPHH